MTSAVTALLLAVLLPAATSLPVNTSPDGTNSATNNILGRFTGGDLRDHTGSVAPAVPLPGCSVMSAGTRDSSVSDLSLLQSVPGWHKFLDHVRSDLGLKGDNWDRIILADTEHLDMVDGVQTYWCPDVKDTVWTWDASGECTNNTQTTPVVLSGTGEILTGTARISVNLGVSTSVTRSTRNEFGVGIEIGGEIGIPLVEKGKAGLKSYWNLQVGQQVSITENESVTQEISASVTSQHPETACELLLDLKTCKLKGSAILPVIASGWVWFHFESKVKGRTNWAYNLESVLLSQHERSASQHVTADVSSTGRGFTTLICDGKAVPSDIVDNGGNVHVTPNWINRDLLGMPQFPTTTTTTTAATIPKDPAQPTLSS